MLEQNTTGLLVVDIQGKLARLVEESDTLISNTARLVQGARVLGLPVVWLEQNPDKLGATVPELQSLQAGDLVLPKYSFGALGEPTVAAALADQSAASAFSSPAWRNTPLEPAPVTATRTPPSAPFATKTPAMA